MDETQVAVPEVVLRALCGKWHPSARHRRMDSADLAVELGCSPWAAGRAMLANRSLDLARRGRSEDLAGRANGQPGRCLSGAGMLAEAGRLAMAALEPEPSVSVETMEAAR